MKILHPFQKQSFADHLQNRRFSTFRKSRKTTPMLVSLFDKVASLQVCNSIKKNPAQVFSCEICEIFKSTFFTEHPQWLLLHFSQALYIPKLSLILLRLLQKKTEILGIVGTNTASIYLLKPPMEMPDQCAKSVQR